MNQTSIKTKPIYYVLPLALCLSFLLTIGCNNASEAPPFPYSQTRYSQPKVKTLTIPEADTIQWATTVIPALKSLPATKFNWDKIPSTPFDIGVPFPMKKPASAEPIDFEALPNQPINLDSFPQLPLEIKVSVLGDPRRTKAGNLTTLPGATRGVLAIDAGFGLPSVPHNQFTDSAGIMWFGLNNGIAGYDSETLEVYDLEQGLEAKYVNYIYEDSKGRLWITGNQGSLSMIDQKANLVYEIKSTLPPSRYFEVLEDKNGLFWVSSGSNGVLIIDFEAQIASHLTADDGLLANGAFSLLEDPDGYMHLGTFGGIQVINPDRTRFYNLNSIMSTMSIADRQGRIWIPLAGGLYILNPGKTSLAFLSSENFGLPANHLFTSIYQDLDGDFWIGTHGGLLFKYNESSGMITKFIVQPTSQNDQWIYGVAENDEGDIWLASAGSGVYKINVNGPRPGNYRTESGLGDNQVWATLEAQDGKIWIGTHGGIDVYDPIQKSLKHLGLEEGLIHLRNTNLTQDAQGRIWSGGNNVGMSIIDPTNQTIQKLTPVPGMSSNGVTNTELAEDGSIWAVNWAGDIQNIDLEHARVKRFIDPDSLVGASRKDRVIQTDENTLWVADQEFGLFKIDLSRNLRWRFTVDNGLISNNLYSLNTDPEGNIWIATDLGVQRIDEQNNEITSFTTAEGLPANDVYDIAERQGKIYLGTSKGLTILQPNATDKDLQWKVRTFGRAQGLDYLDFSQNSISFDSEGKLWAGVEGQMLTVMNPVVDDTTRIPSRITAINVFDNPLSFDKKPPPNTTKTQIDSLNINSDNRAKIDSTYQKLNDITWERTDGTYDLPVGLTLPADQNYLSFNYNGGQFGSPENTVYRYILEGIDKNWSAITDKTISENYRDLSPGEYTFKVASKGFNGAWSEPASFSFTITPPWWQTWWAYLGYLVLLGLLAKQVHKIQKARTLRIEREKSREKELAQAKEIEQAYTELKATQSQLIQSEKMASLGELTAGIAHEIQNPLNFVNNFSEVNKELLNELNDEIEKGNYAEVKAITKDVIENQEKINYHGKRAEGIVKGMLLHSRNSEGKKEPTDINALADEYLRLAYHGLRAKDKSFNADFKTEFDDSLPKIKVVPQDIGRVLLNLINNAFYAVSEKRKTAGEDYQPIVNVATKNSERGVEIRVSDNGPGIPKSIAEKIFQPFFTTKPTGSGTGLGLSLSYDIIKAHGGELSVQSEEGRGTTFSIKFKTDF